MWLYHGSNAVVEQPKILTSGFYKDFGYGFYCTILERQARRWALTKKKHHVVNLYQFQPAKGLKVKKFDKMTEEWLSFVVDCRSGVRHEYDIVEGPMADDTIWDYIEDYTAGRMSKAAFWELVKFKYPTHQIVFCTDTALKTIRFERSYLL